MKVVGGTVDLAKEFTLPVETVFAAWSDEEAQLSWSDPGEGWEMAFDQFHFAVGEADICRFGPKGGPEYINENRYLAIERAKRIVYSSALSSEGRLIFAGTVAVTFEKTGDGARMRLVEQGLYFDGKDDVTGHRSGWEGMLGALTAYLRAGSPEMERRHQSARM